MLEISVLPAATARRLAKRLKMRKKPAPEWTLGMTRRELEQYPFGYLCVRELREPETPVEVPSWFDEWFDRMPEPQDGPGYRAKELAGHLGVSPDAVYAALYDARLEGLRATGRGWIVPRQAVRLWLLESASSNLMALTPSGYWRLMKGLDG